MWHISIREIDTKNKILRVELHDYPRGKLGLLFKLINYSRVKLKFYHVCTFLGEYINGNTLKSSFFFKFCTLHKTKLCRSHSILYILIVKMTYFGLGYVMGVTDCILCAHLGKILKSHLNVISGLCMTHCQQVPGARCHVFGNKSGIQFQPKRLRLPHRNDAKITPLGILACDSAKEPYFLPNAP